MVVQVSILSLLTLVSKAADIHVTSFLVKDAQQDIAGERLKA